MKRVSAFLSLFTSVSTIVCCALPALFILLGAGAVFAGVVGSFPQLVWLSEKKVYLFGFGAVMLVIAGMAQWRGRQQSCPTDKQLSQACQTTKDWSLWIFYMAIVLYAVGGLFAFIIPQFL